MDSLFLDKVALSELGKVELKNYYEKIGILKHLYSKGPDTYKKICKSINVSFPKFSLLIKELIDKGCIYKLTKSAVDGGKSRNYYELKQNIFFVLNIFLNPGSVRLTLIDNTHTIFLDQTFSEIALDRKDKVTSLLNLLQLFIIQSGVNPKMLLGISINFTELSFPKFRNNFPFLFTDKELSLLERGLKKHFSKPIYFIDAAKGASIAELNFGNALNRKDVLVISMDFGINLGLISEGKLQMEASGLTGEFGHIPFIEDGELCYCGKRGCLETVASGYAIVETARKGLLAGQLSILNSMVEGDLKALDPKNVVEAANLGDQFAIKILSDIGINLGKGLAILVQIFNPELIILQGKIAKANKFITTPIEQSINKYCMVQHREGLIITPSALDENTILLGATVSVFNSFFQSSEKYLYNNRLENI